MFYNSPNGDNKIIDGYSFKIEQPPLKREFEDFLHHGNTKTTMDVCALTLSRLAQDQNLPSSKLPFSWKLYEMLEAVHNNGFDTDIVSWVDNGKAFKVHDLNRFVAEIVPKYFKQSKYKSFQRQLYIYEFKRAASSLEKLGQQQTVGSYRHPNFLRGKKTLCLSMQPKKTKRRSRIDKKLSVPAASTVVIKCNEPQQKQTTASTSKVGNDVATSNKSYDKTDTTHIPLTFQRTNGAIRGACVANGDTISKAYYSDQQTKNAPYFLQQQSQLLKQQREQFLGLLDSQPVSCTHRQHGQQLGQLGEHTKQQQWLEVEERSCCIFGGKTFHFVSKSDNFEYRRNKIVQKQFCSRPM